jgi:hypothetical protein
MIFHFINLEPNLILKTIKDCSFVIMKEKFIGIELNLHKERFRKGLFNQTAT